MNHHRMDWYQMLIVAIVTIGVLVMTGCLYLDILLMQRMNERLSELEAARDIETFIEPETIEEPVIKVVPIVEYFDVPLDESLQDHIFAECEKYEIGPAVVIAMIERESRFKADAIGDNGRSFGLMQIQEKWHKDRMKKLGCTDLLDPYQNVTVGIDFLAELIDMKGSMTWALMAYNGGPSYANKKMDAGIVSEYAQTVCDRCDWYFASL